VIGSRIEAQGKAAVPYIRGIPTASLEELKSFCASVATYGGVALFHMEGITPEANQYEPLPSPIRVTQEDLDIASQSLTDDTDQNIDFVSLGCPHLSIREIAILAELLEGKRVTREFWITTSRITRQLADQMGFTQVIEASGAKFAVDTCCVVAPIKNRFTTMVTDSAKACYYARGKNGFKTIFKPFAEVVKEAIK
jgi:predicted aconitase